MRAFANDLLNLLAHSVEVDVHGFKSLGRDTFAFARHSVTRWAAGKANVECVQVEGGHCFMLEYPQATAERVAAFLLGRPR